MSNGIKLFPDFISFDTPPKKLVEPIFKRVNQFTEENNRAKPITLFEHLENISQFKGKR